MADASPEALPPALLWVGTEVETHDGRRGVVQPYEFFWTGQTDFPVKLGKQTLMLTRRHLARATAPAVPAQRAENASVTVLQPVASVA